MIYHRKLLIFQKIFTLYVILFLLLFFSLEGSAQDLQLPKKKIETRSKTKTIYGYKDLPHTWQENFTHWGTLFTLETVFYYFNQHAAISDHGSAHNWRKNFGRLTLDKDEPYWNWMAHPYVGSQIYLYYRANGYDQFHALKMTVVQTALFELIIENYTERPSYQDLYQTPVLGSMLGYGLERLSLKMLNSDYRILRAFGHILNPWTLFWFYKGGVEIIPEIHRDKGAKVTWYWEF